MQSYAQSSLRHQSPLASSPLTTSSIPQPTSRVSPPPEKKRKMSMLQTNYLAHTARGKLSREAARSEHDLRRLVGHANLLDAITLDLEAQERAQEEWFEATVAAARKQSSERKASQSQQSPRVQWIDSAVEEYEDSSDSDSSDDEEDDAQIMTAVESYAALRNQRSSRRPKSPPPPPATIFEDDHEDDAEEDEDSDNSSLALARVPSRSVLPPSPPELVHDMSSDSEDEDEDEDASASDSESSTSPLSPPTPTFQTTFKPFSMATGGSRKAANLESREPAVAAY